MKLSNIVKGISKTELLYLEDAYTTTFKGNLVSFVPDRKKSVYLVLDKTIFHPKGGGQPTDKGYIYNQDFSAHIKKTMFVNGVIVHWGKLTGNVTEGPLKGKINWERRYRYMKRHTAGHLFDHCLSIISGRLIETTDSWLESPCYIGYKGQLPSQKTLKASERMANQMISLGAKVFTEDITFKELRKRASHAPNIFRLPPLEVYRIVTIEGCQPIPCAGTHLKNINEIKNLIIKHVEQQHSGFQVYYDALNEGV